MKIRKYTILLLTLLMVTFSAWAMVPNTQVVGNTTFVPYRKLYSAKTGPVGNGKLYLVSGYNSGSAQYVMIFSNTNYPPTNGEVGTFSFPVAGNNYFSFDFGYYGADNPGGGWIVCNSTTADTNTLGGTNCTFQGIIGQ